MPSRRTDNFDSLARLLAEQGRKERGALARALSEQNAIIKESIADLRECFSKTFTIPDSFETVLEPLAQLVEAIKTLPERQRSIWTEAANYGWYINWYTPIPLGWRKAEGSAALDARMIAHLEHDWDKIKSSILLSHPEREEILSCAFELHKEGRYIASIPLFLAQTDGICAQRLGAHLFTDNEERSQRIAGLQACENDFVVILLEILGLKTQFSAGIKKSRPRHKKLAPNRNGILHGSRKHLDYGTELNSFKAFSLLAFVTFTLSERLLRPHNTGTLTGQ